MAHILALNSLSLTVSLPTVENLKLNGFDPSMNASVRVLLVTALIRDDQHPLHAPPGQQRDRPSPTTYISLCYFASVE
jgi:hypothetical protein